MADLGGAALGGGFELALSCDPPAGRLNRRPAPGLPDVQLGLLPGAGGTQRLTRLCGQGVAQRVILTAEMIGGETSRELGMVQ